MLTGNLTVGSPVSGDLVSFTGSWRHKLRACNHRRHYTALRCVASKLEKLIWGYLDLVLVVFLCIQKSFAFTKLVGAGALGYHASHNQHPN